MNHETRELRSIGDLDGSPVRRTGAGLFDLEPGEAAGGLSGGASAPRASGGLSGGTGSSGALGATGAPEALAAIGDPVVLRHDRIVRLPGVGHLVPLKRLQMALCIVLLNLADVLLTKAILHNGGAEGNPLMKGIMEGFAAPLTLKLGVSTAAAMLLLACPARSRLADKAAAAVVGVYMAIVLWNSVGLIQLML